MLNKEETKQLTKELFKLSIYENKELDFHLVKLSDVISLTEKYIGEEKPKPTVELTVGSSSLNKVLEQINEHYNVMPESIEYKRIDLIEQSTIHFKEAPLERTLLNIDTNIEDESNLKIGVDFQSWDELDKYMERFSDRELEKIERIVVSENTYNNLHKNWSKDYPRNYEGIPIKAIEL